MTEQPEQKRGLMDWLKESVTVKLSFIGVLILVLLIPSSLVENLINERAGRQQGNDAGCIRKMAGRPADSRAGIDYPIPKTGKIS